MEAYVLINVESGKEYDVASEISSIPQVKDVLITYGLYDIVVKVETESLRELEEVVHRIRKVSGVRQTTTLVGVGV